MINTVKGLYQNNEIYVPGGTIGRSLFFINSFLLIMPIASTLLIIKMIEVEYFEQTGANFPNSVFYNYFCCMSPFIYFFYQNIFKRIRDYRQKELSTTLKLAYFALTIIPLMNLIFGLKLLFAGRPNKTESQISKEIITQDDETIDCNILKIDRLISMKEEGHITKEEFEKLKQELIKKAS